jgi:hypothetical protein
MQVAAMAPVALRKGSAFDALALVDTEEEEDMEDAHDGRLVLSLSLPLAHVGTRFILSSPKRDSTDQPTHTTDLFP